MELFFYWKSQPEETENKSCAECSLEKKFRRQWNNFCRQKLAVVWLATGRRGGQRGKVFLNWKHFGNSIWFKISNINKSAFSLWKFLFAYDTVQEVPHSTRIHLCSTFSLFVFWFNFQLVIVSIKKKNLFSTGSFPVIKDSQKLLSKSPVEKSNQKYIQRMKLQHSKTHVIVRKCCGVELQTYRRAV